MKTLQPITRGDYRRIKVQFRLKGEAEFVDMTGGILFFTMKKKLNTPYEQADLKKRVPGTSTCTIIELQNEDTQNLELGEYYYDIQFVDSERRPITIQKGQVAVTFDVTDTRE